ncbi:sulfatase-like hydrolase/transferase [Algisphaera agarilytica]|uniref:Arylsulfatase A-like enzyme n=1 Tax=Algisphaera agarilytica TaxID=1385975 RepID=A0A7X0LKG0_9BACT|nr:sulfatase-like hydrolase/transferase [Algisphaera agarilytica]MBB6429809.1 arylsulfatase A-like enzyme [Algisphaera agarilytica]
MKYLTSLFVSCFVIALTADRAVAAEPGQTDRPNIVYILIDDLSWFTMTSYGATAVTSGQQHFKDVPLSMPHIDALASGGVMCEQAYVYPICEPTRVAILSGMHNGRNFIAPKALHESQITISDVFKRAGYATGMFGKWKQTRGTKEISAADYIFRFGWDEYLCFDVANKAPGWSRFLDPTLYHNGEVLHFTKDDKDPVTGRRVYGPDVCNRALLKFIDDHKDQPFFVYYPMILVHDEHTPTPDTVPASAYDNFDIKGDFKHGAMKGDARQYFPDMLAYMDKLIGKVVEKLEEHDLRENTLIVIMGDNGTKAVFEATQPDGSKIAGGKGHSRFTGEHVGLIFNQPGTVPAGGAGQARTFSGLVDATDIYPTFLEACGIDIPNPDRIDGISVWPQVIGRANGAGRQAIFKWYNGNRKITDLEKKIEFAHTADFKRYAPHHDFPNGRFFDLRDNPWEEQGKKGPKIGWQNFFYHGLDVNQLTPEQQAAYDMLGETLDEKAYVPVKSLKIAAPSQAVSRGQTIDLTCAVIPANATRNNVIWESSNPKIASIDKFGTVTGHKTGSVTITVYSWDDANPVANPNMTEFLRDGVKDTVKIEVRRESLTSTMR